MHEFMTNTVITTAFMFIIMLDIWGVGYWIVKFVKWVKKKRHGGSDTGQAAEKTE